MGHKKLSLSIGLCILVAISQFEHTTPATSQYEVTTQRPDTNPDKCCIRKDPRSNVIDLINHPNVTNATECKDLCRYNETCVGVIWGLTSGPLANECWLKMYKTLKKVEHWSVANCADGNLSYCWKVESNVHQLGGTQENDIKNETECKRRCIHDLGCIGVDWDLQANKCYTLFPDRTSETKGYTGSINHWTISRIIPKTCHEIIKNSEILHESPPERNNLQETINLVFVALLGVSMLIIIGISIYAVKLKKCCSTQKKVDKVKVVDVAKVVEAKVNDYGEAKEDDDESYIDYQDLRRLENPPTTCEEEGCEYTAMELENMKEMEDDDNIYYNEDQ